MSPQVRQPHEKDGTDIDCTHRRDEGGNAFPEEEFAVCDRGS